MATINVLWKRSGGRTLTPTTASTPRYVRSYATSPILANASPDIDHLGYLKPVVDTNTETEGGTLVNTRRWPVAEYAQGYPGVTPAPFPPIIQQEDGLFDGYAAEGGFPVENSFFENGAEAFARADEINAEPPIPGTITIPDDWLNSESLAVAGIYGGHIGTSAGGGIDFYFEWAWFFYTNLSLHLRRRGRQFDLIGLKHYNDDLLKRLGESFSEKVVATLEVDWITQQSFTIGNYVSEYGTQYRDLGITQWGVYGTQEVAAKNNPVRKHRIKYSNGFVSGWTHTAIQPNLSWTITPISDLAFLVDASDTTVPTGSYSGIRWPAPIKRAVAPEGQDPDEITVFARDPETGDGLFDTAAEQIIVDFSGVSNRAAMPSVVDGRITSFIIPEFLDLELPEWFPEDVSDWDMTLLTDVSTIRYDWVATIGATVAPWGTRFAAYGTRERAGYDTNIPPEWILGTITYTGFEGENSTSVILALARIVDTLEWKLFARANYDNTTAGETSDWSEISMVWDDNYYGAVICSANGVLVTSAFERETRKIWTKRSFDNGAHWELSENEVNATNPRPLSLTSNQGAYGSQLLLGHGSIEADHRDFILRTSNNYGEDWN